MAKKEILIIVPSRSVNSNRAFNVNRFYTNWAYNSSGKSDLCIALDSDDEHNYPRISGVIYEVNDPMRMIPTLNTVARKYCNDYKYIAFFGDDHVIQTPGWEDKFIEYLQPYADSDKVAFAYGNDLLQGVRLPTAVVVTSALVRKTGYMVLPTLLHMYADNYWLKVGDVLGAIKYFPDVVFEHLHPDNGKAVRDEQYSDVARLVGYDESMYNTWLNDSNTIPNILELNS